MDVHQIEAVAAEYPARLRGRLGADAPPKLTVLGNLDLLALPKTALFCSARCPGDAILRSYDQAARCCDTGRCVISGFHSPVEK
jgi:predicted Rossmann fold nucleotide-binding protein DprA/Smf involved in DNA uptake